MTIVVFRTPKNNRTLWDRTADKWEHDLYREEEQTPKEPWEVEVRFAYFLYPS